MKTKLSEWCIKTLMIERNSEKYVMTKKCLHLRMSVLDNQQHVVRKNNYACAISELDTEESKRLSELIDIVKKYLTTN